MRTDLPGAPADRLRSGLNRLGERFSALPFAVRALSILGVAGLAIAAGYFGRPTESAERAWLFGGRRFAPGDIEKVAKLLETQGYAPVVVDGKVGVRGNRTIAAESLLESRGLGPRGLRELAAAPIEPGLFEPISVVQERRDAHRALFLATAIEGLDPTLKAVVRLHRSRGRGLRAAENLRISVLVSAEGDRKLSPTVVDRIGHLVRSLEPELPRDGLSLVDRPGTVYLSSENPDLGRLSRTRAREEELEEKISEALGWIGGVKVTVTIDSPPAADTPAPSGAAASAPKSAPTVLANRPIDDEPEPTATTPETLPEPTTAPCRAQVVVQVPTSYVVRRWHEIHSERRRPAAAELDTIFEQTRLTVAERVENLIPAHEKGTVLIAKYDPDPGPQAPAPPLSDSGPTPRSAWPDGLIIALPAALLVAVVLAAGAGWWAARRPATRPVAARRIERVAESAPNPAEQVRELIRIDPAASAAVLHRWIGRTTGGPRP